ncbi:hypothetical protein PF005_g18924 [Phytophthora fragariae]|uniref:Uncharacterized protein n=1 Tax=Phytophthora fragariae TaxID=53985 RepID=A0A6A3SXL4_9STRA|nr:hypothetical protein PF003_g35971 [Phytophthora fragariae]KAE8930016.1 hypothetical protein PF009_g19880 [Phytophthora fragariae]KAE8990719.1 hypothetical protein PF011_g18236 [Phytophthora fragariae]KAE9089962.1 hypothetical protein PF007_g19411 [Phytophthora fragariae]KAE9120132.1 hypothetical protein PF006_g18198 [Phytophthora fragariae]
MTWKWLQLKGEDGSDLTSADAVFVDIEDVAAFRDAVKDKDKNILATVDAPDLKVFANGAAYDAKQKPLKSSASLVDLGKDEDNALIVVMPTKEQQSGLWLANGTVANARSTKGVCCRLYRLADLNLGYYDPSLRSNGTDSAIWYEDTTLQIRILFQAEENALYFQSQLLSEPVTVGSSLNGQTIAANVVQVSREPTPLCRIFFMHYVAQGSDSPQQTMASHSTTTSIIDLMTDEFRYQRIEAEVCFGSLGKAESCHLIAAEHCHEYPTYHEYDHDPNNRLALSQDMHGFYDGLNVDVPVMNIFFESMSSAPVIEDRYEVKLIVRALDPEYGQRIASRLKEGSTVSADRMEMKMSVFVKNPKVFRKCLEWKSKAN